MLNLPSRVDISRTMGVTVEKQTLDEARAVLRPMRGADKAVFVGVIPGGEEVRAEQAPGQASPGLTLRRYGAVVAVLIPQVDHRRPVEEER